MKSGAPNHRKMKEFAAEAFDRLSGRGLGGSVQLPMCLTIANGTMERLWRYAGEYLQDGNVSAIRPILLAQELGWEPGDAEWLLETMVKVGFLDRVERPGVGTILVIHDWYEHAEDNIHRALARKRARFADGRAPKVYLLPERERAEAEAHYKRSDPASAPKKPRSRPRKRGNDGQTTPSAQADTPVCHGQTTPLSKQTPENVAEPSRAIASALAGAEPSRSHAACGLSDALGPPPDPEEARRRAERLAPLSEYVNRERAARGNAARSGLGPARPAGSAEPVGAIATSIARPGHAVVVRLLEQYWPPPDPRAAKLAAHENATLERVLWLIDRAEREPMRKGADGKGGFIRTGIERGWSVDPDWQTENRERCERLKAAGST